MHKLLITDLDDTLYDWSGFFVPAFYAMAEEIAGITGIAMDQLLHEYREVHRSLGTVEFPYATLRLPSIRACFTGMETAQMKEALRPAFKKFNGIRDSRLRLFPGVAETLEALAARGLTIIGYTESSQENGFYRLQKLGADGFFKRVYACESQFQSTYGSNEKVRTVRTKKPNVDVLLDICRKERIQAVTTLIDPEIALLAAHREEFAALGVEVLAPYLPTARLCFDKFEMFRYLCKKGIPTVVTWGDLPSFTRALEKGEVSFPVFVKPRTGSGSVGARKIFSMKALAEAMAADPGLIIQEFMDCLDLDADVYIDTVSHKAVAAFSKKKLETRIGGASKTVSFKDPALFAFIEQIVEVLDFNGPVDMDFFCREGRYYLSEVNPRFGGAYLHAYGAGVDFIRCIENNLKGIANPPALGQYEEGVIMMMYDSVIILRPGELAQ